MKTLLKIVVVLGVLVALGYVGLVSLQVWWAARNKPHFREAEVARGEIILVVNSTGTLQPVRRVQVGTFVSGPIRRLLAYYNDEVRENQLLAEIDSQIYDAVEDRDEASLETRKAEVRRIQALLDQALNDEQRAKDLQDIDIDFISDAEIDQAHYNRMSIEAQLDIAKASVKQAAASLENARANVRYTMITAPEDGIVIDRQIDEGQTLAAQFQTPELFVIAPEMRQRMHIHAAVDEADVGLIREALRVQEERRAAGEDHQVVEFTVAAYPDDLFRGTIHQVRYNPTTIQNVVTYPVVVEVEGNEELKLLPGMTANLSFEIDKESDVLKVPNAALRYFPKPEHVRPEDRSLLEGKGEDGVNEDEDEMAEQQRPAGEVVKAHRERSQRHVWVKEGELLRAVEIVTGISDFKHTELVSGELEEGQKLVTGVGPAKP